MGQQEKQEQQLRKRIEELAARSAKRSVYTYTEFLNLAEQDLLVRCVLPTDSPIDCGVVLMVRSERSLVLEMRTTAAM